MPTGTSVAGFQILQPGVAASPGVSDWVVEILAAPRDEVLLKGVIAFQVFIPALDRHFQLSAIQFYQRGMVGILPNYPDAEYLYSMVAWWRVPGLEWRAGIAG
jgi:hypothetical protein